MNVFERRRVMKNLAEGKITPEDMATLSEAPVSENYGEQEQLVKEESRGRKVQINYHGQDRTYWVPSGAAWTSARRIDVEKAYRVFSEDEKTMNVKRVLDGAELEGIVGGLKQQLRDMLSR